MTTQSTIEQLRSIRLHGMADAFEHQLTQPIFAENSFEQRLQMMLDSEVSYRNNTRYKRLLKNGRLKVTATPEDFIYKTARGLEKSQYADLLTCRWIEQQQNLIMTGATGTGKTWLACSLGVQAARKGITIGYKRASRLLEEMAIAHEDGSIGKLRLKLMKIQVLIVDDFGLTGLDTRGKNDLLELLDDRVGNASTIILGQMPVKSWHAFIDEPALADAILDRLVYSSTKVELTGTSMRKVQRKRVS